MIDNEVYEAKCNIITGGSVAGEAVLSNEPINFYLVDPDSGKIIEEGHALQGEEIGRKIIIFPSDKGSSVVQLDGLYKMAMKGEKPKAMIVRNISTVLVSNAIIMEIPLINNVEEVFYDNVANGDRIEIVEEKEKIILKKGCSSVGNVE